MEDQTFFFLLIVLAAIAAIYYLSQQNTNNDGGKIPDSKVDVKTVIDSLKTFIVKKVENRKYGYTELDIHKTLEKHFKTIFKSVTPEYGLESKNARFIDFDLGNGKVGVEVKLARSIFKTSEWDRVYGQLRKYTKAKYNSENLILLVIGNSEDQDNTILHEIMEDIKELNVNYHFIVEEHEIAEENVA
jgi:hypothetical protein